MKENAFNGYGFEELISLKNKPAKPEKTYPSGTVIHSVVRGRVGR